MLINNVDVAAFGATMVGSPKVSAMTFEQTIYKPKAATWFYSHERSLNVKAVECVLVFRGSSAREIQLSRSRLRAALSGVVDLFFRFDGFHYMSILESMDDMESEHNTIAKSKFKFKAIQHDPLCSTSGATVVCTSTVPYTSVDIKAVATDSEGILAGVPFSGVVAGDSLEVNGMTGELLVNGAPGARLMRLVRFPTLVPGPNQLECSGVKNIISLYYPTYL